MGKKKTHMVSFRIEEDNYARLSVTAQQNNTGPNSMARLILTDELGGVTDTTKPRRQGGKITLSPQQIALMKSYSMLTHLHRKVTQLVKELKAASVTEQGTLVKRIRDIENTMIDIKQRMCSHDTKDNEVSN